MAVGDGIRGTSFDAIAAENAPRVINVVHRGIALTRGNAVRIRVFGSLNVNAVRRASSRAQKAPDAFFQPVLVAMQYVDSAIAGLEMHRLVRVVFRDRLPEDVPESHAKAFHQRFERFTHFTQYGSHTRAV